MCLSCLGPSNGFPPYLEYYPKSFSWPTKAIKPWHSPPFPAGFPPFSPPLLWSCLTHLLAGLWLKALFCPFSAWCFLRFPCDWLPHFMQVSTWSSPQGDPQLPFLKRPLGTLCLLDLLLSFHSTHYSLPLLCALFAYLPVSPTGTQAPWGLCPFFFLNAEFSVP